MAWRILRQPNGLLACFSDVIDDFTYFNMSREDAIKVCRARLGHEDAERKVARADKNGERFDKEIGMIGAVHGVDLAETRRKQLSEVPEKEGAVCL